MQSTAATPQQYLASLPDDRRAIIAAVRDVILQNLSPAGYHCDPKQPLPFAALASQKNYISLYMMGLYTGSAETDDAKWFREAWAASGKKKLDMGKACIRFKKLDDIPLDVIAEAIRRMPAQRYIALYQQALNTASAR